jgi:hypothetical protein
MELSKILKGGIGIIAVLLVAIAVLGVNSIMEYVENTEYAVHQNAFSGELSVWNAPGWHVKMFGKVSKFKKAGDIYLSADRLDGGAGAEVQAVGVLFPDGSADVDVVTRYELSLTESIQKELFVKYGGEISVISMIRQQIIEAVKGVGPLMSSAEAYSDRKPEVAILARTMALKGIFATLVKRDTTLNKRGDTKITKSYDVKRDSNGNPIVTKSSVLDGYQVTLPVFNVKDMKFDAKTVALIEARKTAQKAVQDAITAEEEGKALIAKEKASQDVVKMKAVTIAEKERDVAVLNADRERQVSELNAEKAKQEAIAIQRRAKAEADANALKVRAGLTPQEKAEWNYKTRVGVAKELASVKFPEMLIIGGGGKGGAMNPFDAIGLESFIKINEKMNGSKK